MRVVLFYQIDYQRYEKIIESWKNAGIVLGNKRNDIALKIVEFESSYPFNGIEGELVDYLRKYKGDYSNLYVIIGSVPDIPDKELLTETRKITLPHEVLTAVLLFPEVTFMFEDRDIFNNDDPEKSIIGDLVWADNLEKGNILDLISWSNLYDASNLKAIAREWKFKYLHVFDNFAKKHDIRKENLALVIDEEHEQSLVNSYLIYENGYRSLPISTLRMLKRFCSDSSTTEYSLILRDFDLQFPDEKEEESIVKDDHIILLDKERELTDEKILAKEERFAVDYIRGFKRHTIWKDLVKEGNNPYWKSSDYYDKRDNGKVLFVTQGVHSFKPDWKHKSIAISDNGSVLKAPGIIKPLAGIHHNLWQFKSISETHRKSREDIKQPVKRSRIEHDHSSPLDLYSIASSVVERAYSYYENKRYILASVLAEDAIELLNGQHISLSMKAYHLLAVSNNAITMDVIGSDEYELAQDCRKRIRLIEEDITRLLEGIGQNSQNVLNQIFSDCRQYCQEKEHFLSEEVFISEMAHLNEQYCPRFPFFSKRIQSFIDKAVYKLELNERTNDNNKKSFG